MKYAREMTFGSESSAKGTVSVYVPDTSDYIKRRTFMIYQVCDFACVRV